MNTSTNSTTSTDDGVINSSKPIDESRCCWVCFATHEDDVLAEWVQPCKCSGTTKWVHQQCLQRWVDEKQKGNSFRRVNCPQCQTEYIIVFPSMGTVSSVLEGIDNVVKRLSPFLAASVMVGSLYWTAVTYGAVTVLQVIGHKEGLQVMENSDPLVLLIGLPAIPVALIMGRMIRWDDMVLKFIQNRSGSARKYPFLSLVLPISAENSEEAVPTQNVAVLSDQTSGTRVFCGALLLPSFAAIFGRLFFESIQNNVHRTLIGGLTFIMIKGVFKIYFKQKQFVRRRARKIMDYNEENLMRFNTSSQQQIAALGQFL